MTRTVVQRRQPFLLRPYPKPCLCFLVVCTAYSQRVDTTNSVVTIPTGESELDEFSLLKEWGRWGVGERLLKVYLHHALSQLQHSANGDIRRPKFPTRRRVRADQLIR